MTSPTKITTTEPKRVTLAKALRSRSASLWTQRTQRSHNPSMDIVQQFLRSYPYATDQRVDEFVANNKEHVERCITKTNQRARRALLG